MYISANNKIKENNATREYYLRIEFFACVYTFLNTNIRK